jgi:hypothetical protein
MFYFVRSYLWHYDTYACPCKEGMPIRKKHPITRSRQKFTFSALLAGLDELKAWLEAENYRYVAMESSGIYWQPSSLYKTS